MYDSGIYTITNTTNGKVYIGSSSKLTYRFYRHRSDLDAGKHHCRHLQRAWIKYGRENFAFDIIEAGTPRDELLWREQVNIDALKSTGLLYNECLVAGNCIGVKHAPGSYAARSARMLGVKRPASVGKKVSASKKGVSPTITLKVMAAREKRKTSFSEQEYISMVARWAKGESWKQIASGVCGPKVLRKRVREWLIKRNLLPTGFCSKLRSSDAACSEIIVVLRNLEEANLLNTA